MRALKLHGYSASTIDVYARAVRRLAEYYDRVSDRLITEQLAEYFSELIDSHSWGTVRIDHNGLQFFRLVTFTLPAQLRTLAWNHQRPVYAALLRAAHHTLKQFGLQPKHLGADMGMTAVLHTHSRRLTYHPHVHVVVPGGGVDRTQKIWKRTRYRYLFNAFALAKVFRGKFLHEIGKAGLKPRPGTQRLGGGLPPERTWGVGPGVPDSFARMAGSAERRGPGTALADTDIAPPVPVSTATAAASDWLKTVRAGVCRRVEMDGQNHRK